MKTIEIKPYRLKNPIQNYSWGTKNNQAFIPRLLGFIPEKDKPYAELWMGAHPKAPSSIELESGSMNLQEFINANPEKILGKEVAKRFSNKLPFLFKVLSAAEALSIQAHPNKKQAELLHKKDPVNYPDDNHKPEIAIALDNLYALIGFRPFPEIQSVFENFPELKSFIGTKFFEQLVNEFQETKNERSALKKLYEKLSHIVSFKKNDFDTAIKLMRIKINAHKDVPDLREKLFLDLNDKYGSDIGLISLYLLNLVELKKGQGIFLNAGIPHAYLEGNIIECMANSDNVVRAGLTPKFQDSETLLKIMEYKSGIPEIFESAIDTDEYIYGVPVPEFQIKFLSGKPNESKKHIIKSVQILILIEGALNLITEKSSIKISTGSSLLIPASLKKYEIHFEKFSEIFIAYVAI
ncbi:MAG: mannose-6-phosphate isomerase, class I [Calditrichae bacterium]|nr:mannose-6-phosphate isomerase, class I [Calditrichia bacterium]